MGAGVSSTRWLIHGVATSRDPGFVVAWAGVIFKLVSRQITCTVSSFRLLGMLRPLQFLQTNLEVYWLIRDIELNHLMENALQKRMGSRVDSIPLAHVDTSSIPSKSRGLFGLASLFWSRSSGPNDLRMQYERTPISKDIVLVGGGHSHVFVIKNFGMNPEPGARLTLITDNYETPYSGMLPGFVAGVYSHSECHIDLARLCSFGKVRLIVGRVNKIDRSKKLIYTSEYPTQPPIGYDVLSIDVGIVPRLIPCSEESPVRPIPVKPISTLCNRWDRLKDCVRERGDGEYIFSIVGAGPGGVELALAMHYRLCLSPNEASQKQSSKSGKIRFILVSKDSVICSKHNPGVQKSLTNILASRGIEVVYNFPVNSINEAGELLSADGRRLRVDACVFCTSACAQNWIKESGFNVVSNGNFAEVGPNLESTNTPNVFAAGDCATMVDNPRPKAGVFAVRQGPPLAENLRRAVRAQLNPDLKIELIHFSPQTNFLGIISAGPGMAVASRGVMALTGRWLWFLKDWIDRKWMASYSSQLPLMSDSSEDSLKDKGPSLDQLVRSSGMRCGGCGSKVGKRVLDRALQKLDVPSRQEVLVGLESPDDCAVVAFDNAKPEFGVVQTVDFFRSFLGDPFLFGRIAAVHALSDCYAMCAKPVSAMAIAVLPFGAEEVVERDLTQIMGGVCQVLKESNCALVGGHSCEGRELALGLSVSGVLFDDGIPLLTKGGMKCGDVLVLTKPLGTGVIFAGDMRVLATGNWVQCALESMLLSNKDAALLARRHNSHACTDVTGFGLIGHLIEMLRASESGLIVDIKISDLPLLPGSLELVRYGVLSSLHADNQHLRHTILDPYGAGKHEAYPLLFDPQTSGGLLVSLPAADAADYVRAVQKGNAGPFAKVIGSLRRTRDSEDGFEVCLV